MNLESDDTDHDDNLSFDNDGSADGSEHATNSINLFIEHQKKPANPQFDRPYNFGDYIEIYERMYTFFSQGEHQQWRALFDQILQQSSTPYQLLYMFLDHTLSTSNSTKHKMVIPLIDQFKENQFSKTNIQLAEKIKHYILSKICRRCASSQLESIVDIFDLHAIDNRALVTNFIHELIEQQQDIIFIARMTKVLKLLENDAVPLEKILVSLILKSQWEMIKMVVGDARNLQGKLLKILDSLISTDPAIPRRLLTECAININVHYLDTHSLKRAARKFLKHYQFDLHDLPNLATQEKVTFLKTLFVRKYLERKEDDDQSWNEQIKELIQTNRDLQVKLVDLFVDYTDIDSAVQWACLYNLEDFEIPEQVSLRRQEIIRGDAVLQPLSIKQSLWSTQQSEVDTYQPTIRPTDIVYIELDANVDAFLNRLEVRCSRCDVGSHLPFVGFDCETFTDPTQRTLNSQIVSIIQLASSFPSRHQTVYGVFDMLALRLQFDLKNLAEFAQRLFCSRDFILLTYNYAGDTSSLIENYPSMTEALMQGTAVIDLFPIQQYIVEHHPQVFPYYESVSNAKSRGLSELVRLCFGKPLDKSLQSSDWRKRPLKQAQLIYSVIDARILVDIALFIEERTRRLNIPWSWSDYQGYKWTNKAFKKRTGMNQQSVNTS